MFRKLSIVDDHYFILAQFSKNTLKYAKNLKGRSRFLKFYIQCLNYVKYKYTQLKHVCATFKKGQWVLCIVYNF